MMKNKIIIFLLVSCVLAEIFFLLGKPFLSNGRLAELMSQESQDYLVGNALMLEHKRWSEIIDIIGPERAYASFKEMYEPKPFGTQHIMAHVIGSLLYEKEGIGGQVVCDSTFSFGCYHSFFSEALIDKGPAIIEDLNQACLDKFGPLGTGCQHGIGHGVIDFFGHDKLLEALDACETTTAMTPVAGCTSGVFMEYNLPIIIGDSTASAIPRAIDKKEPYAPCPSLPKKFQESCYYSIGQWWNQTTLYNNKWKEQGLLCKNIPNKEFMEWCFIGVGNVAAPDNQFNPDKAIDSCKQMPDKKSVVICQAGASWSFAANKGYESLAIKMCGRLDEKDTQECLIRGNLLNPENHDKN